MLNKLIVLLNAAPAVKEIIDMFSPEKVPTTMTNKKRDTTKFNEYHVAVIKAEYAAAKIHNCTHTTKISNQELADLLNLKFDLNKSVRSYSRIWNQSEE